MEVAQVLAKSCASVRVCFVFLEKETYLAAKLEKTLYKFYSNPSVLIPLNILATDPGFGAA